MKWTTRIGVGTAAVATTLTVGAIPAFAHPIDYINWNDNHTLCTSCRVDKGDVVGFWQAILVADGYVGTNGYVPWYCDVDGYFGSGTRSFTKGWQSHFNLSADGIVGEHTWDTADTFVLKVHQGNRRNYYYLGATKNVKIQVLRSKNGKMIWQPPPLDSYPYYNSSHPGISFQRGPSCG